jgi:hypothetical protein
MRLNLTVKPHSVSHGILNKQAMVRIVVKAQEGTSSSSGTLAFFVLNTLFVLIAIT